MLNVIITILLYQVALSRFFRIEHRRFYDPQNGQIIFHGLNIINKKFPYEIYLKKQDIEKLKQTGLNAIRTDVSWVGLEPEKGVINQTYLQNRIDFINMMGQNGFYTLLEFHQDLFSEKFCGDGVPMWALPPQLYEDFATPTLNQPPQYQATGKPTQNFCWKKPWNQFYKTYASNRAFKALYSNRYGLRDAFKNYWKIVAKAFKGNPYIIGYQIINEPWPGNMYKNPLIMVPGLSQMFNLRAFHNEIALAIRQIDPDQNIGFQPVTWLNALPSGYSKPPGGKQYANRSILCFHYYSPPTYGIDIFMSARRLDMKRLKVGGLLTEFMAVAGTKGDPQNQYPQILQKCDKYNVGWFAWVFHQTLNYDLLTRVYAQRVGGNIVQQQFDPKTYKYILTFESFESSGNTVIFFPKKLYPDGFVLIMDPMTKFTVKQRRFIIIQSRLIGNRIARIQLERPNQQSNIKYVYNNKQQKIEEKKEDLFHGSKDMKKQKMQQIQQF